MKDLTTMNWVLIGAAVAILYVIMVYNKLISLRNNKSEAWSDIEVQMKRRYDLIPNLVETVKGYAKHEKETLDAVVNARNSAMQNNGTPQDQAKDENMLSGTLKSIFALSEAYPDLKANESFIELQQEITDTEDKVQASRRFYNSNVRAINIATQQFPKNLVASAFGFKEEKFFELDEAEKAAASKPVKVGF